MMPELGQTAFGNKWEKHEAPGWIATGLYELSEMLGKRNPEAQSFGLLGGEWGYGQDFENEVFEMHPYWWGDCECGFDQNEVAWTDAHPHDDECYQSVLRQRFMSAGLDEYGYAPGPVFSWDREDVGDGFVVVTGTPSPEACPASREQARDTREAIVQQTCTEMRLDPHFGALAHCTCTHNVDYANWRAENDHASRCRIVLPNFTHKPSGLAVHWYKYIGRSMTTNREINRSEWRDVLAACVESL